MAAKPGEMPRKALGRSKQQGFDFAELQTSALGYLFRGDYDVCFSSEHRKSEQPFSRTVPLWVVWASG